MESYGVDQYFELALDLPAGQRAKLLDRLDAEEPALGAELRSMLERWLGNPDFACATGVGGRPRSPRELDTLHHVAVQVGDIPAAVAWYRGRFACEAEYQDATWALLRFANFRLALVLPGQHPPHVAVSRPDAAAFGELQEHRDGSRSTYTTDPWGNAVEVLDSASLPDQLRP